MFANSGKRVRLDADKKGERVSEAGGHIRRKCKIGRASRGREKRTRSGAVERQIPSAGHRGASDTRDEVIRVGVDQVSLPGKVRCSRGSACGAAHDLDSEVVRRG